MKLPAACYLLGLGTLALAGCAGSHQTLGRAAKQQWFPISNRDAAAPAGQRPYQQEDTYLEARRRAAFVPGNSPRSGLALSGGGIRSATLNLGFLQALQGSEHQADSRELQPGADGQVDTVAVTHYNINYLAGLDYLSTVSGGSFIGAWFVSRLTPGRPAGTSYILPHRNYDERGVLVSTSVPADLLTVNATTQASGYAHLGNYAPFLAYSRVGGTLFGAPSLLAGFLLRIGPNAAFNLVLPSNLFTGGKSNFLTANYLYQRAIRRTYLYGADSRRPYPRTPPQDLSDLAGTPLSGALTDRIHNAPLFKLGNLNPPGSVAPYLILNATLRNAYPGAPKRQLGAPFEFTRDYCGSSVLGYVPTAAFDKPVARLQYGADQQPTHVLVKLRHGGRQVPDFTLQQAVSASGAALYPHALALLAANAQYNTRNYARVHGSGLGRAWRVLVADRFNYQVKSNAISLADGGLYDNLGIVALVRRRVPEITVMDASADPRYHYDDLLKSQQAVHNETCGRPGCQGLEWKFDLGHQANFPAHYRYEFLADSLRHRRQPAPRHGRLPPGYVVLSRVTCACPGRLPAEDLTVYYCKLTFLPTRQQHIPVPDALLHYKLLHHEFPHIGTAQQIWTWSRFEAYRNMGYYLGREYVYFLNHREQAIARLRDEKSRAEQAGQTQRVLLLQHTIGRQQAQQDQQDQQAAPAPPLPALHAPAPPTPAPVAPVPQP